MSNNNEIHAKYYLVIAPDATFDKVELGDFMNINRAVGGHFDFVRGAGELGGYIHDEGLLIGLELNVVASILLDRALFGPVVMCMADADDEGETIPPTMFDIKVCISACLHWQNVRANAAQLGQDLTVRSNADTVPPPRIVPLTDEMLKNFFGEGE